MSVVGLSGAQGAGKSTLLSRLADCGVLVDHFKVSRAVQKSLGWGSLSHINESFETIRDYQEEVYTQKLNRDIILRDTTEGLILTERTFADLYAYAETWVSNFFETAPTQATFWLESYKRKCLAGQCNVYSQVLLLPLMDHVVFENDPHRANFDSAAGVYEKIVKFSEEAGVDFLTIDALSVDARVDQVQNYLIQRK